MPTRFGTHQRRSPLGTHEKEPAKKPVMGKSKILEAALVAGGTKEDAEAQEQEGGARSQQTSCRLSKARKLRAQAVRRGDQVKQVTGSPHSQGAPTSGGTWFRC